MGYLREVYASYTPEQRRNIGIYIGGIMMYKFGLEFFNGSITTLATDRFRAESAITKLGAAQGLNQAMQVVGSIAIAPLVRSYPTRTVLSAAAVGFGLMTTILLIVDAATGGKIRQPGGPVTYGNWPADLIFPIWGVAGIFYGMIELIRRVIPADIVGGDVNRLRRMDAMTHVLYEVAGTSGAFASSAAISRFGNNTSYMLSPIFFTLAAAIWYFISALSYKKPSKNQAEGDAALSAVERKNRNYFVAVGYGFLGFGKAIWVGAKIIFGSRKFIWLPISYSLALYLHRFLESSLSPAYARRVLGTSAWSQIIVGGSNFGELLGALTVFLLSNRVPTPLPWLRLDAIALNIVWVMPTFANGIAQRNVTWAWITAACFLPISYGWASGDVSLAAYIQSTLSEMDLPDMGVSPLGSVMAFLFSAYIILNAVLSSVLGKVIDRDFVANRNIVQSLREVGGIQFSVCCGVILLATLIPKGAFAFNPKNFNDTEHQTEILDGAVLKQGGSTEDSPKEDLDDFSKPVYAESDKVNASRA